MKLNNNIVIFMYLITHGDGGSGWQINISLWLKWVLVTWTSSLLMLWIWIISTRLVPIAVFWNIISFFELGVATYISGLVNLENRSQQSCSKRLKNEINLFIYSNYRNETIYISVPLIPLRFIILLLFLQCQAKKYYNKNLF